MSDQKVFLYQPPGQPWGTPNLSPFCIKLECYLRMAKVPYETRAPNVMKSPKGKIPYVEVDGRLMGDSQLIIEHLERTRSPALDDGLAAEQHAVGHAVRRMLEEGLYFVGIHLRWALDDGFALVKPEFRNVLPAPVRLLLPIIRRKVVNSLRSQGTGRHSDAEIQGLGKSDISALASILGDKPFLLGAEPRTCDAAIFGFMESIGGFPMASEVRNHLLAQPNLVAYRERIRARFWK